MDRHRVLISIFALWSVISTATSSAWECPDPNQHQAVIGGDRIDGVVLLRGQPLTSASVRLYFSSGKTAWVGETDKNGAFIAKKLSPGIYDIDVEGWGKASIGLDPERDKDHPQRGWWSVQLLDDTCISWTFITN